MSSVNARNFYLANETVTGTNKENYPYYDCQKEGVITFFNLPEGLGAEYSYELIKYGTYSEVSAVSKNDTVITGELIFKGKSNAETYDLYYDFINYVTNTNLVFVQELPTLTRASSFVSWNGAVYGMDVRLNKIEKSEIDSKTGALRCNVEFLGLNKWINNYTYPQEAFVTNSFSKSISSSGNTVLTLTNDTSGWQNINIQILSDVLFTDVRYTLSQKVGINTNTLGRGRVTISTGVKQITIQNIGREQIITSPTPDQPIINYVNYSYAIKDTSFLFLTIPPGTSTLTIAFVSDNTMSGEVRVFMEESYDTV